MSTMVLNQLDGHDESTSLDTSNLSDEFEVEICKYRLSEEWRKHSLEKCLNLPSLVNLLAHFGANSISYYCEKFGVTDVNIVKEYEKKPIGFFVQLLKDYAVNATNKEKLVNRNNIKTLVDLQEKLWNLNSGKLVCKKIKENENDLLKELSEENQNKIIIGINLYKLNELSQAKIENKDILVINSNITNNNYPSHQNNANNSNTSFPSDYAIKPSSSASSVLTDSSTENQIKHKSFPRKKLKVSLFYHENQEKNRISQFVNKFSSTLEFEDLTKKSENDLENELDKENLIFILFDKQTDELIDAARDTKKSDYCKCQIKSECKCNFYKKFYELIYKMYLDRKNKKYYTFLMDDFDNFKNEKQNFKYKWLLREKQQNDIDSQNNHSQQSSLCSEKKIYVKPYQIPEANNEFNKRLVRFIENLPYSPYLYR